MVTSCISFVPLKLLDFIESRGRIFVPSSRGFSFDGVSERARTCLCVRNMCA